MRARKQCCFWGQAATVLAGLLLLAGGGAVAASVPQVVSIGADGNPGSDNSGTVFGDISRRPGVTAAGEVFFLSTSKLAAGDTNAVVDVYRYSGTAVTVTDLPAFFQEGVVAASVSDLGDRQYVFRLASAHTEEIFYLGSERLSLNLLPFSPNTDGVLSGDGNTGIYRLDSGRIYLHDLSTNTPPAAVAITPTGVLCSAPSVSTDGQSIAFSSTAALVATDTNSVEDVFLYRRTGTGGTTSCISRRREGLQASQHGAATAPALSGDASTVAFLSNGDGFMANPPSDLYSNRHVYVGSITGAPGMFTLADIATDGTPGNADADVPQLSQDGRFVVFTSKATNLGFVTTGSYAQVYVTDRALGTIEAVSTSTAGAAASAECFVPAISPDGRYVAFVSTATNLVTANTGGKMQVYRVDRGAIAIAPPPPQGFCVSVTPGVAPVLANAASGLWPFGSVSTVSLGVSGDGKTAVFSSRANNLSMGDTRDTLYSGIFLRDLVSGSTRLVFAANSEYEHAVYPVISGDQSALFFLQGKSSTAPWKLRHLDFATGEIVTIDSSAELVSPSVSRDGQRVVYVVKNGGVWMRDMKAAGPVQLAIAGANPAIAASGQAVVFAAAGNIVWRDLTVAGLDVGTTVISTDKAGSPITSAAKPVVSASGRYVLFLGDPDGNTLYRKDVGTGVCQPLAANAGNPAMSADGRIVYYTQGSPIQAYVLDAVTDGAKAVLLSQSADSIAGNGTCFAGALSANGGRALFASSAPNLVANDINGVCDLFQTDLSASLPANSAPVATLSAQTMKAESSLVVDLTWDDANGDDVEVEIVTPPAHAASWLLNPPAPGKPFATLAYTPATLWFGEDSFSYRCRDAAGWSAPKTVTITVNQVNVPVLTLLPRLVLPSGATSVAITADMISVTDADYANSVPPSANITLKLAAPLLSGTTLTDINGADVAVSGFTLDNLPLTYTTTVSGYQREVLTFTARDSADPGTLASTAQSMAIVSGAQRQTLTLAKGWNLISFTMTPVDAAPATLFRDVTGQACIIGSAWRWNAAGHRCEAATVLNAGEGYWVYAPQTITLTDLAGIPASGTAVPVVAGWNLIGAVGAGSKTLPVSGITGHAWWWRSQGPCFLAVPDGVLEARRGYWIFVPAGVSSIDLRLLP